MISRISVGSLGKLVNLRSSSSLVAKIGEDSLMVEEGVIADSATFEGIDIVSERIEIAAQSLGGQDCVRREELPILSGVMSCCLKGVSCQASLRY